MKEKSLHRQKNVITYGTFDLFHIGHVRLLERARALGDRLIVAVSTDEFNTQKGKSSYSNYSDRSYIVSSCKFVDLVIPETSWDQKIDDIALYEIDIFVIGDDWKGKFDFLNKYCEVIYLERTPEISTTKIKTNLKG